LQLEVPEYPVVFTKPPDALTGPNDAISICPGAQHMLDYEGELTIIISKDCKNLPLDVNLSEYVLGYTAGNDVSARNYQLPAAGGGQYGYAKSFDGFAPIGPWIASPRLVPDPKVLRYKTRVNGEVRQETGVDDMIWSVQQILHHLSRGTTLRAGTVIMTGTPSGVGFFRKQFLKDGDVVEVEIEGLMTLNNRMEFEKQ
jgi:transcription initiation factor TFIIH subunit 2